ncbi:MAG: DUF3817 domain-containing protein [Candidatus Nanopelagicales bacterium]|jgi:integral membrane protein
MNKIPSALLAFRIMAWVTGVVLASATVWALLGYLLWGYADDGGKPGLYSLLWVAHGWLYFAYLIAAVNLAFLLRFPILKTVALLLAGTIPFASFYADFVMHRYVRNLPQTKADTSQ